MKKSLFLTCVLALVAGIACAQKPAQPVLSVEGGQIQGVPADVAGVTVFRGIPFAAPPIGDLRWKAPQPVVPWEGVRVCDTFGHPPFQAAHYPGGYTTEWGYGAEAPYSEDCLYLNVWTKAPGKVDAKLPVAVWVFGGGMREGWSSEPEFDGQEWAGKDVVLVSFNYRVGPFGFFADTEDELGIVAVLQLELQGSVLDDRQDLVGELLRGFDAHFLPRGLTEVHIAGEAGREGAERADFADLDKVDALLGAVADNGGAIETDNAGCDQEAADQDQEKFHR